MKKTSCVYDVQKSDNNQAVVGASTSTVNAPVS